MAFGGINRSASFSEGAAATGGPPPASGPPMESAAVMPARAWYRRRRHRRELTHRSQRGLRIVQKLKLYELARARSGFFSNSARGSRIRPTNVLAFVPVERRQNVVLAHRLR
jgi:hypothetical protein